MRTWSKRSEWRHPGTVTTIEVEQAVSDGLGQLCRYWVRGREVVCAFIPTKDIKHNSDNNRYLIVSFISC